MAPTGRTVALFGGTFDPPHDGHLAVARAAVRHADEVWWVPAADPYHKADVPAPFPIRARLVDAVVAGEPAMITCRVEAELTGPSRTFATLAELRRRHPDVAFLLVVGADQAATLHRWYRAEDLLATVPLLVARRAGTATPPLPPGAVVLDVAAPAVSSTAIRQGRGAEALPSAVAREIAALGLYRRAPAAVA